MDWEKFLTEKVKVGDTVEFIGFSEPCDEYLEEGKILTVTKVTESTGEHGNTYETEEFCDPLYEDEIRKVF